MWPVEEVGNRWFSRGTKRTRRVLPLFGPGPASSISAAELVVNFPAHDETTLPETAARLWEFLHFLLAIIGRIFLSAPVCGSRCVIRSRTSCDACSAAVAPCTRHNTAATPKHTVVLARPETTVVRNRNPKILRKNPIDCILFAVRVYTYV